MQAAFVALLYLAVSGSALAETWHVTTGPGDSEHATWTLDRSGSDRLSGAGELTKADGSKVPVTVLGSTRQLMSADSSGNTCVYRISEVSSTTASGKRYCVGAQVDWRATIDNPTDMSVPVLLKEHVDPRATAAYKALSADRRSKFEADVEKYRFDLHSMSSFLAIRDMKCLSDQYLNIRMQKPNWKEQDIGSFISLTCIVPDRVHEYAESVCGTTFPSRRDAGPSPGGKSGFCTCYADHFTKIFVQSPNNTNAGETNIGVQAALECRGQG